MTTRRHFMTKAVMAGASIGLAGRDFLAASRAKAAHAKHSLKVLILGGTGFVGRAHVEAALSRGHQVASFSRRVPYGGFPGGVEVLTGDRNGHLESIQNRDWDAVIDAATYGPLWVKTLGEALRSRVKHYTFISTINVYRDFSGDQGPDEQSPLLEYAGEKDPYSPDIGEGSSYYAEFKVLCEREAERQFSRATLVVRPGLITGPGEDPPWISYWLMRTERGGEVLVPGDPLGRSQLIDVRDLAGWVINTIEGDNVGIYNAVGPASPTSRSKLMDEIRVGLDASATFTWVPTRWLLARGITLQDLPLWWPDQEGSRRGYPRTSNARALAKGLKLRPLRVTAKDTLEWLKAHGPGRRALQAASIGWPAEREREALQAWHAQNAGRVIEQNSPLERQG